jgi:adenine-specific DNA-methyltransferase
LGTPRIILKHDKIQKTGTSYLSWRCPEILRTEIADESIDLIFVDPPYNIGKQFSNFHDKWPSDAEYTNWTYQWIDECIRVFKANRNNIFNGKYSIYALF